MFVHALGCVEARAAAVCETTASSAHAQRIVAVAVLRCAAMPLHSSEAPPHSTPTPIPNYTCHQQSGYREGLEEGKAVYIQQGFDAGAHTVAVSVCACRVVWQRRRRRRRWRCAAACLTNLTLRPAAHRTTITNNNTERLPRGRRRRL